MCFRKKLFVIGNGFDLHHKLPTRYEDYKNYLKDIDSDLVDNIDTILEEKGHSNTEIDKWSMLEEYLGEFPDMDYDSLYDDCFNNSESDMDRASYWEDPQFNANEYTKEPLSIMKGIKKYFKEWVDSIDLNSCILNKNLKLKKRAYYLNFNYTTTLEEVYEIPKDKILHIHSRDGKYILGHNCIFEQPYKETTTEDDDYRTSNVKEKLNDVYREIYKTYHKNSVKIIENNKKWLSIIKDCYEIVFMGLSMGKEDMVYIDHISSKCKNNCKIIVYYHSEDERKHLEDVVKSKFGSSNIVYIEW